MDIEIGRAKRGRRAYSFDDIAIVPSRRTRDPEEVSVAWQIDAYRCDIPVMAAPMDSVMSPDTAIAFGRFSKASGPVTTTPSRCCAKSASCADMPRPRSSRRSTPSRSSPT